MRSCQILPIGIIFIAAHAAGAAVETLKPYESESGIVTAKEIGLARQWFEAIQSPSTENNWLDQWLNESLPFHFNYDGRPSSSLLPKWRMEKAGSAAQPQISWTDPDSGLKVIWQLRKFEDFPAVEWMLTLENTGSHDTRILDDIQDLDLGLRQVNRERRFVVHGVNGGRSFADDMVPFSREVGWRAGYNAPVDLGGDYPSSNRHLPFFNVETPDNRGVIIGIGWSGHWAAKIAAKDDQGRATAGVKDSHFVLHPGEHVRGPRILAMYWEGKRLHGSNMFRRLIHEHYQPRVDGQPDHPLVSVNVCFTYHGKGGFLHQANEKTLMPLVKPFEQIGAEVYIIDAGWYDGAPWHDWQGNWVYSREKYLNGFGALATALSAARMRFGLWFASEAVNKTAPVLKEHPEWVAQDSRRNGGTLRMELPEAREWFLKQVDELANREGMNCYRQDGAGRFQPEPDDRRTIAERQHLEGLYQVWDEIVRRHPNMLMEGCSGGGRRIDLETVSRFAWHQKADRWYDSDSDQSSMYGGNLYLPGGTLNLPTEATDDYGAWSSFAGQFCLGWHPLDNDFPMALAQKQVQRYKKIRPMLSGDFYPLTPGDLDAVWLGYQFHKPENDSGFALIFRRDKAFEDYPAASSRQLKFRGVDPQGTYRVRFESSGREQKITGRALNRGIEVALDRPRSAELIIYERAQ